MKNWLGSTFKNEIHFHGGNEWAKQMSVMKSTPHNLLKISERIHFHRQEHFRQMLISTYFSFMTKEQIIIQIWQMIRMIFCITKQISIIAFNRKKSVKFKAMTLTDVEIKTWCYTLYDIMYHYFWWGVTHLQTINVACCTLNQSRVWPQVAFLSRSTHSIAQNHFFREWTGLQFSILKYNCELALCILVEVMNLPFSHKFIADGDAQDFDTKVGISFFAEVR